MTRFGTAALALATATLLVGSLAPVTHAAPAASLVTLKNGLRVVFAPDSSATAVDLAVWYPVGIGAEGKDALGSRHLIERLMFRGSANVPDGDYVKQLAAEGATANTQMVMDYSCFYETLPAEALGAALALEADRMAGLKTTPQAFEECRRATIGDIHGRAMRPLVTRVIAKLGATVYRDTPYERIPEGDEAVLARMTPTSVDAWRRSHYGAGGAVLTIVGRFDADAALASVRRLFEPLPRGAAPGKDRPVAAAGQGEARTWERSAGVPARMLMVGWRVPGVTDPDSPAIELLAASLASTDASSFSVSMTQKKASASFAQCGLDRHKDASMLWTVVALAPSADSAATELQVEDIVGALRRDLVADADLGRVRARFVTGELLRQQGVRARAQTLGDGLIEANDLGAADRRLAAVDKLTPEDLKRVANRVITDDARSIVWLVPAGGGR